MDFAGSTVLITGAASGIGLATARLLAARGCARLILCDIDAARLAEVAIDGPAVTTHAGDVADEAYWDALAGSLAGLDMALVNAGVAGGGAIAELAFDEWRRVLRPNLDGAFLTLRAAMRAMAGRPGAIVLTASAAGLKAEPGIAPYAASKAAVIHLARVAAKEGARQGLRVNAIAPGGVETPIWDDLPYFRELAAAHGRAGAFREMARLGMTPLGRYAAADEVAAQIAFLLSDAAATITGTVLVADGGYVL